MAAAGLQLAVITDRFTELQGALGDVYRGYGIAVAQAEDAVNVSPLRLWIDATLASHAALVVCSCFHAQRKGRELDLLCYSHCYPRNPRQRSESN